MAHARRGGGWLGVLLGVCLVAAGCADRRVQARADEADGPPVRGGTLEIVGSSDVDHLATTSAYVTVPMWLFRTFTRPLLAYPAMADVAVVPVAEYKLPIIRSRRVRHCTWAVFGLNCDLTALWLAAAGRE